MATTSAYYCSYFIFIHLCLFIYAYEKGCLNFRKHLFTSVSKKQCSQNYTEKYQWNIMVDSLLTKVARVLGDFQKVKQSWYPVENLLVSAFVPQHKLSKECSGALKTCKTEGCILQAWNLLYRNSMSDFFLETFRNFQNTFKKFGLELVFNSLASCRL